MLRLTPAGGAPIDITKDQAIVGREPACDLFVNDGSVSRRHARLERRGGAWFVVDQGSANGTFLDSQRVSDALLRPGQELRFGVVAFRVEILGETPGMEGTVLAPGGRPGPAPPGAPPRPGMPPGPPPPGAPPQWPTAPPPGAPPRPGMPPGPPPPGMPPQWPSAPPPGARPPGAPPPVPSGPPPQWPGAPPPGHPPPPGTRPGPPPPSAGRPPSSDTAPYRGVAPVPPARRPRPPRPAAEAEAPARPGRSPWAWAGIGCGGCLAAVLLLLAGFAGFIYIGTRGPLQAVRTHLEQVRGGDLDAAHQGLSERYRGQVDRQAFAAFVERHPAYKGNTDSTFLNRSFDNDQAALGGSLTGAPGQDEPVRFALVREGGAWKISGIEVGGERPEAVRKAGPERLRFESVGVQKRAVGPTIEVVIQMNVSGFEVRPEGVQYGIDLELDVETIAPTGERVEALSREGVRRFQRSTSMERGAVAPMTAPLILDRSLVQGRYVVRLTVHDRVGGGEATHEVAFDFPEGTPPTTTTTLTPRP